MYSNHWITYSYFMKQCTIFSDKTMNFRYDIASSSVCGFTTYGRDGTACCNRFRRYCPSRFLGRNREQRGHDAHGESCYPGWAGANPSSYGSPSRNGLLVFASRSVCDFLITLLRYRQCCAQQCCDSHHLWSELHLLLWSTLHVFCKKAQGKSVWKD